MAPDILVRRDGAIQRRREGKPVNFSTPDEKKPVKSRRVSVDSGLTSKEKRLALSKKYFKGPLAEDNSGPDLSGLAFEEKKSALEKHFSKKREN